MPTGEFEYIRPPRFYGIKKEVVEDFLPPLTSRRKEPRSSNPLISGKRPEKQEDANSDSEEPVDEVEIILNDDDTSTVRITVKKLGKPHIGRPLVLQGLEEEIIAKYQKGAMLKDLAQMYGVSIPCMAAVIRRGGGEIRNRGRRARKKKKR